MKKIIRIASVIALASASLLYVGCTKDFSADLAKTNSEVAAQASKVAALEATVGTLNSTVENLKTTKADAAAVNALQADLEKKIDVLAAALEQTALLAKDAKADAEAVAADLEVEKAKLDSIILVVDTLAIKSDSLRKDVDSLYKNSASMAKDINALKGRVEGLESRITSLVAIPSLTEEIVKYNIDTIKGEGYISATIFSAKFAVTPKDAKIDAKDLGLIIKEGLTKGTAHESIDSVYDVTSAVFEDGVLTVSTKIAKDRKDIATENTLYYSLVFNGKDANGTEYSKVSEFIPAKVSETKLRLENIIKFVCDGEKFLEKTFADTISYAETKDTVFSTSLNGNGDIMAEVNGEFITLDEFATILGTKASKLAIDTIVEYGGFILFEGKSKVNQFGPAHDPWTQPEIDEAINWEELRGTEELSKWEAKGFTKGSKEEDGLNGISTKDSIVFSKSSKTDGLYYGNKTAVKTTVTVGHDPEPIAQVTDSLYIGAKNKGTFKLGTSTEDWYYDYAVKSIVDSFVIKNAAAAKALGDSALTVTTKDGEFSVKGDKTEKVQVNVDGVKYAKVAADTTYSVNWATTANITKKADSTFLSVNWNLKVGPRPADPATIKFAVDTTVVGKKDITAKFKIFANSIAAVDELDNRVKIGGEEIKSITINGKALDLKKNPAANRFSFSVEDGIVTFKNAAEGTTVVVATAKCAGITFTYEFTLNLTKGKTPKFKALTAYLKVEGDKSFSAEIAAPERDTLHKTSSFGSYVGALNTLKFNQYFVVDTTDAAIDGLFAEFKQIDSTASKKAALLSAEGSFAVNSDKVTFGDGKFKWNTYDSLAVNVAAYLVVNGVEKDTIDQVNIKFWTADPIKSVTAKNVTVKHNSGSNADKVDLDSLFVIKDLVDSTVWGVNGPIAKGTYEYGQNIVFGADSTWTFTGGTTIKNQVSLDANHVLTLAAQGATIENDVTVEIPFTVKHALDKFGVAAEDRQGTVKVTFTK